jgi:FixJ family two-component response regulator
MVDAPVIAIVDDDEAVRASLASLVRSLGYEVRAYGSGDEFLRESRGDPACMIADIQMPLMTGDELQARLIASGRAFPIIFMTAFPTEPVRRRVIAAGARCYLSKPSDGDEIIRCLEQALAGHASG